MRFSALRSDKQQEDNAFKASQYCTEVLHHKVDCIQSAPIQSGMWYVEPRWAQNLAVNAVVRENSQQTKEQ